MSKRKPTAIFHVDLVGHAPVYVIARHAKGAASVAAAYGYTPDSNPKARPRRVDDVLAERAINCKTAKQEAV